MAVGQARAPERERAAKRDALGADAQGKIGHSSCVHVQGAENRHDQQQERDREEKKREKQFLYVENAISESGEQESVRSDERAF